MGMNSTKLLQDFALAISGGKHMKESTQIYLEKDGCYLMLHRNKKENDMNEGKWIAAGGKFEPGETAEQCAARELLEETGYQAGELIKRAEIKFLNDQFEDELLHIYTCTEFQKTCQPVSDEGDFHWIPKEEIFELNLWEGDRVFLEKILKGDEFFRMSLLYSGYDLIEVR